MSYLTIKSEAKSEFEEKKSVFIGHAKRIYSEEEARDFINKTKVENKESNHNVLAYVIGVNMGIQRYSDDGEPQGTAGVPVLEVIKKNNLTDIVIVVTRYFGGVLLGAGGLVRAYSKGASSAIKEAGIVEKIKGAALYANFEYDHLGKIQYMFAQNNWYIEEIFYSDKVKVKYFCEAGNLQLIKEKIVEACSGRVTFEVESEEFYFKLENRLYKEQ
ncbi:YigZ family protein [Candidatus Clostridium stratigraminis]|uniref:YigZ family protein n=1 Tax=Candidatus Clostridium stratigraminis TaxID=3381661 RepID=A0ABW8T5C1_9CLOT